MPSPEQLAAFARQSGYREATLEKVLRLLDLLADIDRHPLLSQVLVLKGGTALHLGFGQPQRLSVDLDFNYVGSLQREVMESARPQIEEALQRIATAQGYQVQWSRPAHAGRKCFLAYRSASATPDRIEVDLNFLHRQLLLPPSQRALWSPDPTQSVSSQIISLPELCAGKICALLDRMAPRDLFDMAYLHQLIPQASSDPIPRAIIIALSGALTHPIYSYKADRNQRLSEQHVTSQLHPMLLEGQRPTARELLDASWPLVEPFLDLTEAERAYVDLLQQGKLQPELLFPEDEDLAEKVRHHPVLLWKAHNAAQHR